MTMLMSRSKGTAWYRLPSARALVTNKALTPRSQMGTTKQTTESTVAAAVKERTPWSRALRPATTMAAGDDGPEGDGGRGAVRHQPVRGPHPTEGGQPGPLRVVLPDALEGGGSERLAPRHEPGDALIGQAHNEPGSGGVLAKRAQDQAAHQGQGDEQGHQGFRGRGQEAQGPRGHQAGRGPRPPQKGPEGGEEQPPGQVDHVVQELGGGYGEQDHGRHQQGTYRGGADVPLGHMEHQAGGQGEADGPAHREGLGGAARWRPAGDLGQ